MYGDQQSGVYPPVGSMHEFSRDPHQQAFQHPLQQHFHGGNHHGGARISNSDHDPHNANDMANYFRS